MAGITVTGLSTDLPIDTWIEKLVAVKQEKIDTVTASKTALTTAKSALGTMTSTYSSLLTSLQKITDSNFGSTSDLFAQKTATTSDSGTLSATATALAATQNLKITISQLATSTTAQSVNTSSAKMTDSTLVSTLASGSVTAGDFSIYVGNTKHTISVATTDNVGAVLDKIENETGLTATITDGKLTISDESETPSAIVIGSNADTTNFTSVVGLSKTSASSYASTNSVMLANTEVALTGTSAGFAGTITAGSFKIGNDEFTIDATTTMDEIITQINNSDKSNASAYWDAGAGKLVLTSKSEGATNINIEAGTSNFTDMMGLTSSTWDPETKEMTTSNLVPTTQELGVNAKFTINGTSFTSASNTVTSDVSGVSGLTFTLKDETAEGKYTTVNVAADNSSLTTAITSFVKAFNTAIANTDEATAADGYLKGESVLIMIRDNIRKLATASVAGEGDYKSLADIGITTGKVGASIDDNTDQLIIDADVLAKALTDNPESVKKMLIGDGTTEGEGVLQKLTTIVDGSMDPVDGYFITRDATYATQVTDKTTEIDKKTAELETYKTYLQNKFSVMEQLIASLNSQLSTITSVLDQAKANNQK